MSRVALINLASLPMAGNDPIFPIGLRCVQDALDRAGHQTRLIDFVEAPNQHESFAWLDEDWDVIGFTVRNIDPIDLACDNHVAAYALYVDEVRRRLAERPVQPLLVGGGPGFSLYAGSLVERLGLHLGVVGPGEQVMLDVARSPYLYASGPRVLDGRRHPGFMADVLEHPSSLMAAYSADREGMIGVETRRKTCFQGCVYCPYAHIAGDNDGDLKPIAILAQEIMHIYDAGFRRIFFTDGIFNSELRYAKMVVGMLKELALPDLRWGAYFTPKPFDEGFAELLSCSGVETVVVSPDSLDDNVMRNLGKTFDTRHVLRFLERARKWSLPVRVNVVFGGPGETYHTTANSTAFINKHLLDDELVMHVGYRVLPNTSLAAQVRRSEADLLAPTFFPFDMNLFQWVLSGLQARFLTPGLMMNLMAGRASARRMAKVGASAVDLDTITTPDSSSETTFLALVNQGDGRGVGREK